MLGLKVKMCIDNTYISNIMELWKLDENNH